ncbi:MAG TPA: hypothetical protein EYP57_03155 [Thermodesulfobacteriaceae bacterium]|nr:hypothetical protein [Thermodesulfobacteriaceae bacterium]
METTGMIIRMIGALAAILGLLMLTLYGIRRWGRKLQGDENDMIQVLGSKMLLPRKHICLVRVGEQTLIIGASENGMNLLGTLDTGQVAASDPFNAKG